MTRPYQSKRIHQIKTKRKKSSPIPKIHDQSEEIKRSKGQPLKIKTNPKKSRGQYVGI